MDITKFDGVTMTLKEITDLLEVRHDNAMKIVAKMVENPDFGLAPIIQEPIISGKGREQLIDTYQLNKRQSIAVASRLNVSLLMLVIDKIEELEGRLNNNIVLPDFTNPAEAAIAWAEQWKERERLQLQVDKDAPLVAMAETLMDADVGIKMQEFARIQSDTTGLGRNKLYNKLRGWNILDRKNKPFQRCIDAGWFYMVEIPFKTGNGFEGINQIVMITPKGQKYLTKRLREGI